MLDFTALDTRLDYSVQIACARVEALTAEMTMDYYGRTDQAFQWMSSYDRFEDVSRYVMHLEDEMPQAIEFALETARLRKELKQELADWFADPNDTACYSCYQHNCNCFGENPAADPRAQLEANMNWLHDDELPF